MDSHAAAKVLVVDDEPLVRDIMVQCLEAEGHVCTSAESAEQALELMKNDFFELVVSDIMMPGKSGIELLEIIRNDHQDTAVIMVTAVDDRKTAVKALQLGAFGYVIKPFELNEISISVFNALERRRLAIAGRKYEARLENDVRERTRDLQLREEEICLRLTAACEYRDQETGVHTRRLGLYAFIMAEALGWDVKIMDEIRIAAAMHDIGKIGVPDNILQKPGKLTPEEFEIIKQHTVIGARILSGSDISLINLARDIALAHHEKWNGSGYPNGLAGEDIPAPARVVAILDVYDALIHERVYRPPIPEDEALGIMQKDRGTHFDPSFFDIFLEILPKIRSIRRQVLNDDE